MSYKVIYTREAEKDLIDIYRYIAVDLLVPETAKKQTDGIMDAINSLDEFPLRHKRYDREPWSSIGLRIVPVDNYLVFYLVNENEATVAVVRIMYGGRNIELQLSKKVE